MGKVLGILFIVLSSVMAHASIDRTLSYGTTEVDVDKNVWDFSKAEEIKDGPLYKMYGDTLITEIWNGCRQWYSILRDSVFYIGEESRFSKIEPDEPIPTSAFGNIWLSGIYEGKSNGIYYKTFTLGQHGSYESSLPIEGKIILSPQISISAKAVTECRRFVSWIRSDTIQGAVSSTNEIMRTRWFVNEDPIPVALQITEKTICNGKEMSVVSNTFVVNHDELDIKNNSDEIKNAIDEADINVENGILKIEGDFPPYVSLNIYIANLNGNRFYQQSLDTVEGHNRWDISLPQLPAGQYILTVSSGGQGHRKVIFII